MSTQKILVIDDDETIHKIVEATLTKNSYEYIGVTGGPAALKALEEQEIDGILLDRIMPEMDGNEVLKQLKSDDTTAKIPVVMLTGENMITDVSESLKLGAEDYIVKPFDPENLIVRLKHALNA